MSFTKDQEVRVYSLMSNSGGGFINGTVGTITEILDGGRAKVSVSRKMGSTELVTDPSYEVFLQQLRPIDYVSGQENFREGEPVLAYGQSFYAGTTSRGHGFGPQIIRGRVYQDQVHGSVIITTDDQTLHNDYRPYDQRNAPKSIYAYRYHYELYPEQITRGFSTGYTLDEALVELIRIGKVQKGLFGRLLNVLTLGRHAT